MKRLQEYQKTKDMLVCVDSDGCAMDTMDVKHIRCFGPCMIMEWGLEAWEQPILTRWNEINLYSLTRGINRFKGLAKALKEIHEVYLPIEGVNELVSWAKNANELSNDALKQEIEKNPNCVCLKKALAWSLAVNRAIDALPESEKLPFPLAKEAFKGQDPIDSFCGLWDTKI